jgi:hypothetical protein
MESTYEEATRCPKCGNPGEVTTKRPAQSRGLKRGTMVHTVYCRTQICPWYNTCWIVQVNPDGSVPPPTNHAGQPKVYQPSPGDDELIKQVEASLMAQREAEIDPERREIKNPFTR